MNGKEFNRRAFENLIRAGAFDSMGYRRRALLTILDDVVNTINRESRDNISGQMDLFGNWDEAADDSGKDSIPLPDVEDFTPRERMAMEREMTGLYLSGHPMDEYREAVRKIGAVPIGAILSDFANETGPERFADNQTVVLAGVIASHRTRTTKNNSLMCYAMLEDDSGSIELIVFQKVLDTAASYIVDNQAVLVRGRISLRDEKDAQIVVDSLRPISDIGMPGELKPSEKPKEEEKLWIKVPSASDPVMHRIQLILTMFPGNRQMIIWCEKEKKRLGARCLIHEGLLLELEELLGKENVVVK